MLRNSNDTSVTTLGIHCSDTISIHCAVNLKVMFAAYPYGNESICFWERLEKYENRRNVMSCGFRQQRYIAYLMQPPVMLSLLRSESERQISRLDIKDSSLIKCTPRNPEYNSLTDSPTFTGAHFMCVAGCATHCICTFKSANTMVWLKHTTLPTKKKKPSHCQVYVHDSFPSQIII